MLPDLVNRAKNSLWWCTGWNNGQAILDVMNDNYYYNDSEVTLSTKIKQIGTETLHALTKWATITALAEKILHEDPKWIYALPVRVYVPTDFLTAANYIPDTLGIASIMYCAYTSLQNGAAAWKSAKNSYKSDIYGGWGSLDFNNAQKAVENTSAAFLTYYFMRKFGYELDYGIKAAMVPAALLWASNYDNELIHDDAVPVGSIRGERVNQAFKILKGGIVVWTALQSPAAPLVQGIGRVVIGVLEALTGKQQ